MWLAGCETTSTRQSVREARHAAKPPTGASDGDATGSVARAPSATGGAPPLTPELLGDDPNDDLSIAKKYFRQGSYGLAERHFRKAVELHPRDAESWSASPRPTTGSSASISPTAPTTRPSS